jgi:RNA polymerase-binding transcription factor DksA
MDGILQRCEANFIDQVCTALIRIQEDAETNRWEAMAQLDSGTYGYCLDCLVAIPLERLEAVTFAVRCGDCEDVRPVPRR